MKNTNYYSVVIFAIVIFAMVSNCKKNDIENPYGNYSTPKLYEEPTLAGLPTDNFGYLHATVFKPTCANSGCHDGHFEPDYRTIGSAYNNMVNHKVLTNDASGSFTYRVKPGDAAKSLVHERLLVALPSTSGIMPAVTTSEWLMNKASHIKGIKDWINAGAKDMYGNDPVIGNPNPVVTGFNAYANNATTSPYARASGAGILPILIPRTNVDFWFSVDDDATASTSLTVNQIKVDSAMFEFDSVSPSNMTVSAGFTANNFSGTPSQFTHKFDFDASGYPAGKLIFVRVYIQDADHSTPAENPSDGSSRPTIYLFTLFTI